MKVLLILNSKQDPRGIRILVEIKTRCLRERVINLLQEDKGREAFELLVKKGEPDVYLAPGQELPEKPAAILNESLL